MVCRLMQQNGQAMAWICSLMMYFMSQCLSNEGGRDVMKAVMRVGFTRIAVPSMRICCRVDPHVHAFQGPWARN